MVKMSVAYDGTAYCGFQRQRRRGEGDLVIVGDCGGVQLPTEGKVSIQEVLEAALGHVLGQAVKIAGAGRTDAGVHARGQVVSFQAAGLGFPVNRLPYAVNRLLPPDIVVTAAEEAPVGFHARFSARSKLYSYSIWRAPFPSPFLRRYTWHLPKPLDLEAMAEAAACLVGKQDFAAFHAAGRPVRDTVRNLMRCDLRPEGDILRLYVEADGFLYKMVRTIVGTLVAVGRGRWRPAHCREILASRDRRRAGPAAPPQGLCLEAVCYES